jgi:hypothetical protein
VEEHHEPHIHVGLLVTMEEREAGIVGSQLDFHIGTRSDEHRVLDESAKARAIRDAHHLKAVAMQVDRMIV